MELLVHLFHRELATEAAESRGQPPGTSGRFVLSKGHATPVLYAAAAGVGLLERGLLPTLRRLGSPLQGHPEVRTTPFVEASTGSLGQGFSAALGMALGLRHQRSRERVYALLGDGELQEGQVWEAAMFAAHHRLANLCAVVDYNKMQSDDENARVMGLAPLADKWRAFGWRALEIDGHDFEAIDEAFALARTEAQRPTVIIAHTIKGQGVSYMEGSPSWHGSVALTDSDLRRGLRDLGADDGEIGGYLNGSAFDTY